MSTRLLAASLVIAAASLTLTGCGSTRDLDHKSIEAKEAQKRIDELEKLLADCESSKSSTAIKDANAAGTGDEAANTRSGDACSIAIAMNTDPVSSRTITTAMTAIIARTIVATSANATASG